MTGWVSPERTFSGCHSLRALIFSPPQMCSVHSAAILNLAPARFPEGGGCNGSTSSPIVFDKAAGADINRLPGCSTPAPTEEQTLEKIMTGSAETRPPLPPFSHHTAVLKVRA